MTFRQFAAQHGSWAMGVLGWTPCAFWAATPADVHLAWRGWCALHGLSERGATCDRSTFDALRLQFPD